MTRFPTASHLASWGGTTPGSNQSAGKVKSSRTRPGNPYLQGALGAAAIACAQNPSAYLGAKYRPIATRRGPQKANAAVQHAMLTAVWHMAATGSLYDDPGGDCLTRLSPQRARTHAVRQLQAMGYHVTHERPWATTSPTRRLHDPQPPRQGPAQGNLRVSELCPFGTRRRSA
jgi:hypothetical protein